MRCLLVCLAGLVTGSAVAGPVPSTGPLPARIEEVETAGQLLKEGKMEEALKLLQEAKRKYPALAPPRLLLGRLAMQVSPQNARPIIEQAATEEPDHPDVFLTMAQLAMNESRVSDAILNAQKVLELTNAPRWTADQKTGFLRLARTVLAGAYEYRRDWANARTQLAALLELDPKSGPVRQRLAAAQFQLGKTDEAYQEFQAAAKDDSSLLPAAVNMARQYMLKNEPKKASEFFDRAIKQEVNNVRVHVTFAEFLLQQGDVAGARQQTELAARADPKNVEVQRMQALVARYARDYATAMKVLEDIIKNSPGDPFATDQLALILADQNDPAQQKKALQYAEVNARQYTNDIGVASTLGYCLYRTGNVAQAQQVLVKCVTAGRPVSPDIVYFTALALSEQKQNSDEVKRLIRQALDATGLFFFRKEAKALLEKLEKDSPPVPKEKAKAADKAPI